MTTRNARKTWPFSQILLLLMAILVLYLVVDFGRQVGVSRQRREDLRQLSQQIDAATKRTEVLESNLKYAASQEAAEAYARRNGKTRPGEVLVVFVGDEMESAPEAERKIDVPSGFKSKREAWLDLFFGSR